MRTMKNSGVEWIGAIPEDWDVGRTKNYYSNHKNIVGEQADNYERLALTLNGVIKRSKEDSNGLQPEAFNGYQILKENELVFKLIDLENIATSRVGLSPYTGIVSPAYIILKGDELTNMRYGEYFFLSMWQRAIFNQMGDDGVRSSLNASDLLNIPYIFPTPEEQKSISEYLDGRCVYIDNIIEKTKQSIEEYRNLRQTVITQAVLKGVRGDRSTRASGIEWIGEIPEEWETFRVASLYEERKENGNEELPILTVSINTGVSDRELSDEESERAFVRSEDRSKYMRVYPGDLTYNMMRAWQGAFGAVRVDGMVSPAYVIVKPRREIDSRYMEALLRTQPAKEEMKRYSHGIADFRLRLYWDKFRTIKVCFPPIEEQREIADYIDQKCAEIDTLIAKKEQFLTELENYKKSMIYEYVTGKKEVPHS